MITPCSHWREILLKSPDGLNKRATKKKKRDVSPFHATLQASAFFLPVILFSNSEIIPYYSCNYSFLSATFSYKNTIKKTNNLSLTMNCCSMCCCCYFRFSISTVQHLAVPYIVQGVHAVVWSVPFHCSLRSVQPGWPLVRTLNHDRANLTPNYSSFISAAIIPKGIPK